MFILIPPISLQFQFIPQLTFTTQSSLTPKSQYFLQIPPSTPLWTPIDRETFFGTPTQASHFVVPGTWPWALDERTLAVVPPPENLSRMHKGWAIRLKHWGSGQVYDLLAKAECSSASVVRIDRGRPEAKSNKRKNSAQQTGTSGSAGFAKKLSVKFKKLEILYVLSFNKLCNNKL